MKKFPKIAGAVLAVYLLLSAVASVLVVEVVSITPAQADASADVYGMDRHGRRIYGYSPADDGREKITVFAWEPFNNFYDATFLRLDF